MTVRAVTDLPEPDSPTMAMVSPRCSWKETSRTASTMPPSTLKVTRDVARVEDQRAAVRVEVEAFRRGEVD